MGLCLDAGNAAVAPQSLGAEQPRLTYLPPVLQQLRVNSDAPYGVNSEVRAGYGSPLQLGGTASVNVSGAQNLGRSFPVSARKAAKRPASEADNQEPPPPFADLSRLPANFQVTPAPRAPALDPSDFRAGKRHAVTSAGPHAGPGWLKSGPVPRTNGGMPPATAPRAAATVNRFGTTPFTTRSGLGTRGGLRFVEGEFPRALVLAGSTGPGCDEYADGCADGDTSRNASQVQWQRAVRVSVSTIRPAHGRPNQHQRPTSTRYGTISCDCTRSWLPCC